MQLVFSLGLLLSSVAFTAYGLTTLDLQDSVGRPGPGYFPLIVGALLILTTAINTFKDFRSLKKDSSESLVEEDGHDQKYFKDSVIVIILITVFLLALKSLGSILSMMLFMILFLSYFNKGKHKFNIIYSLLLPIGVFVLFDVLLRAGLPQGILDSFY